MSLTAVATASPDEDPEPVVVEVVVPVYNEEEILEASVRRLRQYLDSRFPLPATIVIADNASTDGTWPLAARLTADIPGVQAVHVERKGRGLALRTAWGTSRAAVVAYMDVDLSTDLDALLPLVAPLLSGHSDVAIGSRLAPGARVTRSWKREVISRGYNVILRAALGTRVSDAQCGFKATRADVARQLLPLVEDNSWFFDSELLVVAEHLGLRIHEVAVDWVEDPDSRVDLVATAWDDLKGIRRLRRHLASVPPPRRATPRPAAVVAAGPEAVAKTILAERALESHPSSRGHQAWRTAGLAFTRALATAPPR